MIDVPRILPADSLTAGTIAPAMEVRRLLKQISREKHAAVRRALLCAVEELIAGIRKHEEEMAANEYRVR